MSSCEEAIKGGALELLVSVLRDVLISERESCKNVRSITCWSANASCACIAGACVSKLRNVLIFSERKSFKYVQHYVLVSLP